VLGNFYSSFKYINQALVLFFWQRLEKVRQRWQNENNFVTKDQACFERVGTMLINPLNPVREHGAGGKEGGVRRKD